MQILNSIGQALFISFSMLWEILWPIVLGFTLSGIVQGVVSHQTQELVDVHYSHAEKLMLVLDNLNTHTPAALYKVFPPADARRLVEKLEIHYTPKHGSWLNMAEIELSVLSQHPLSQRIGTQAELQRQVEAWQKRRNQQAVTVDWRFTTEGARIKLKHLYPSIEGWQSSS